MVLKDGANLDFLFNFPILYFDYTNKNRLQVIKNSNALKFQGNWDVLRLCDFIVLSQVNEISLTVNEFR